MAVTEPRKPARPPYLSLLFRLKWKLMFRGYVRNSSALFGIVLALCFFGPIAIRLASRALHGFETEAPPMNEYLLGGVLLGVYAFWILTPLLGYALNDSYDVTKLFIYPLTVRQIFIGVILGSLIDFPILFIVPVLVAIFMGFAHTALTAVFIAVTLFLFLFHTLSLNQAVMLAGAGLFRSRRYRDIAMFLLPVLWIVFYAFSQNILPQINSMDWSKFVETPAWTVISFLPPGLASKAISAMSEGNYAAAGIYLSCLILCTVGTVYAASWLLKKVFAGEAVGRAPKKETGTHEQPVPAPVPAPSQPIARKRVTLPLPPVIQAVTEKELKYLFRDPSTRSFIISLICMFGLAIFAALKPSADSGQDTGPAVAWGAMSVVLITELKLVCNIFGTEGDAASTLFLYPASRRQIIIGKSLPLFGALSVVNLAFILLLCGPLGFLSQLALVYGLLELGLLLIFAVGTLSSILFPFRVVAKGSRSQQQSATQGCTIMFIYVGVLLVVGLLWVPNLLLLLWPQWVSQMGWYAVATPAALLYTAAVYGFSLFVAGPLLTSREVEIIEKVSHIE